MNFVIQSMRNESVTAKTNTLMDYFPLKVELDYSYSFGALDQYFKALAEGRALGTFCPKCGRTSFPPKLICDIDHSHTEWRELEGTGVVRELTAGVDAHGQETQFALIAMDGADNLSLGRLKGSQFNTGDRIMIDVENPNASHPAQCAVFRPIE